MHTTESGLLLDWKIHCLQARPCIFQPGNFNGWGNEGVNISHAFIALRERNEQFEF